MQDMPLVCLELIHQPVECGVLKLVELQCAAAAQWFQCFFQPLPFCLRRSVTRAFCGFAIATTPLVAIDPGGLLRLHDGQKRTNVTRLCRAINWLWSVSKSSLHGRSSRSGTLTSQSRIRSCASLSSARARLPSRHRRTRRRCPIRSTTRRPPERRQPRSSNPRTSATTRRRTPASARRARSSTPRAAPARRTAAGTTSSRAPSATACPAT